MQLNQNVLEVVDVEELADLEAGEVVVLRGAGEDLVIAVAEEAQGEDLVEAEEAASAVQGEVVSVGAVVEDLVADGVSCTSAIRDTTITGRRSSGKAWVSSL